jgi:hypothetical protein
VSDERRGYARSPWLREDVVAVGGPAARSVLIASHRAAKISSRRIFVAAYGTAPPSARPFCLTERALPPWCASRPLDAIGGRVRMLFDEGVPRNGGPRDPRLIGRTFAELGRVPCTPCKGRTLNPREREDRI